MKTLLVEDNPADARLIREMLKEHTASTFEVQHVTRLDMALKCLREETFDVLLLDLGLPDAQGIGTLTATLLAIEALPIVVLSGLDDEALALEAVRAGAQDYLVKGRFDTQLLVRTIRYAVKRKQADEDVRRLNAELEMRVAERTLQFQVANEELQEELAERKRAEEALQESENRLRLALDAGSMATWDMDVKSGATNWNDEMFLLLGYESDPTPASYEGWKRRVHPEDLSRAEAALRRSLEYGGDYRSEYRVLSGDDEVRWVEARGRCKRDANGNAIRSYGVMIDITERKRAERELQTTLERFYLILSSMYPAVLLVSSEGVVEFANQAFCDMYSLQDKPADLVGVSQAQCQAKIRNCYLNPEAAMARILEIVECGEPVANEEFTMQNGRTFLRDFVPLNVGGKLYGRQWLQRDITERKRAEEALRHSEKQLQQIIDGAPDTMVFLKDLEGRFITINTTLEKSLGVTRDEIRGKTDYDIITRERADLYRVHDRQVIATGQAIHVEETALAADGKEHIFLANKFPLFDAYGKPYAVCSISIDITERKQAEQIIRESESKYRGLFNSIQELLTVYRVQRDLNGRIVERRLLDGNPAFLRAAGASSIDELRGRTSGEIFGAAWSSSHADAVQQAMDSGQSVTQEVHHSQLGRDYITTVVPLDEDTYLGTGRDITERKRDEAELNKVNRTLEAMRNSNEAILRATDEQPFLKEVCHIITRDCNHAMVWIGIAEKNEGKTVRPVAYSGIDEGYLETIRVTWDSSAQGRGPTGTAIRTGQPSMCRNVLTDPGFAPWREEAIKRGYASSLVIPLKERGETWGAITIYSREPDAFTQSEVDLLMDLARDLEFGILALRMRTARARAEEALRESEERLSHFVEYAPASLAMFDKQMRYLRVSQRWRADYRLGDRDLCGISHYDVFPEITDEWKEAHRRGLAGEALRHEAERFERADGTAQWIRWEILPWRDAMGMVGGILIFTEDLTEQIQAAEALLRSEKVALQGVQLRALAQQMTQVREEERKRVARDLHDDLGQLLTAIKMDLTWTKRHLTGAKGEVQDRLTRSIGMISDGAKSVRDICNGLRPGVLDDLGLSAALEWQVNEFASRTGIGCEIVLPSTHVHLDSGKSTAIFRIFQECLTNVTRHAQAKSVRVSLRGEDGNLFLIVQDDGVGFRESSVSNTIGSLGLLGMKERAQAYGGEVIITSSPGNGTTVTIRVPAEAMSVERQEK